MPLIRRSVKGDTASVLTTDSNNSNKSSFASHLWNRMSKSSSSGGALPSDHRPDPASLPRSHSGTSIASGSSTSTTNTSHTNNNKNPSLSSHSSMTALAESARPASSASAFRRAEINPQYTLRTTTTTQGSNKTSLPEDSPDPISDSTSSPSTVMTSADTSPVVSMTPNPHDSTQTLRLKSSSENNENNTNDSNNAISRKSATSMTEPVIALQEYTSRSGQQSQSLSGTSTPVGCRNDSVSSAGRRATISREAANRIEWEKFYNFVANSRESDCLVYALTRKEAWIQYNGAKQAEKPTLEIVELWTMMALRFLLKNRLLYAPRSLQIMKTGGDRVILDIQGLFKDHWGWQMSLDFPQATVYGLRLDPHQTTSYSDLNHEGPPNYIPCVGHSITRLPFDDNFFDVVCARTLWYLIRNDQWVGALKDILRVLRPGGVLELMNCDYDVVNSSPHEDGKWWDRLKGACVAAQIDPSPSTTAARKLLDTGFQDIHRAMIALPCEWGGQIGHLTDFLFLYYFDSLYQAFGLLAPDEVEEFRECSRAARDQGYFPCGNTTLFYCIKPTSD